MFLPNSVTTCVIWIDRVPSKVSQKEKQEKPGNAKEIFLFRYLGDNVLA